MSNIVDRTDYVEISDIDTIYITCAGYTNYPFAMAVRESGLGWTEPTWSSQLNRSVGDFVLTNIDTVDFGLVERCEMNYRFMTLTDYKVLCEMTKQRTCTVNYYRKDIGQRVTQEMAFTDNEYGSIYYVNKKIFGMTNINVKLVATNRDKVNLIKQSHTVTFNNNGGSGTAAPKSIVYGGVVKMPEQTIFTKTGKVLAGFNTDNTNSTVEYLPEQTVTLYNDMTLYAVWE